MKTLRIAITVVGILLPYAARIPRGSEWLQQYTDTSVAGFLFFGAFNAIAWGALLGASSLFRHPRPMLLPCLLGFGFLAWAHYNLDLAADAQAAIALVLIPIFAVVPIAIGVGLGWIGERLLRPKTA